jgi:poly(A) polymerase
MPDGARRLEALEARLRSIPPEAVQPPPLVTGEDLLARGVPPGPVYREVLDVLYARQLNEELTAREAALATLEGELRARGCDTRNG